MPSDAGWRSLATDPRSLVGWTFRAVVEQSPLFLASTLLVLVAVAIVAMFCGLGVPPDLSGKWSWPRFRRLKASPDLASLAPMPANDAWFPICVQFRRNGVRLGKDEGIATFFDGWLVFEGRRTTFSLRNADAFALATDSSRLRLTDGSEAELVPYNQIDTRSDLQQCFESALRRWLRSNIPTATPTLPPSTIHPWAWGQAFGAILLGLLFAAGATALAPLAGYWTMTVATVVALCGLWRMGQGFWDLAKLRTITRRCIRCAPRCANATKPAGTPS